MAGIPIAAVKQEIHRFEIYQMARGSEPKKFLGGCARKQARFAPGVYGIVASSPATVIDTTGSPLSFLDDDDDDETLALALHLSASRGLRTAGLDTVRRFSVKLVDIERAFTKPTRTRSPMRSLAPETSKKGRSEGNILIGRTRGGGVRFEGSIRERPQGTFLTGTPMGTASGPAPIVDSIDSAGPEPPELHWNTRVLANDVPVKVLQVKRIHVLETWLGPEGDCDAILDSFVAATAVAEGVEVTISIGCEAPVLRKRPDETLANRVEDKVTFHDGATPRLRFEVVPAATGSISLVLSLYTSGALRVRTRVSLPVQAGGTAARPGAMAETPSPEPKPQVSPTLLVARRAQLRLEIGEDGTLNAEANGLRWGPGRTYKTLGELGATAVLLRDRLVSLSKRYVPGDGPFGLAEPPDAMLEFAKIGAELHSAFFGGYSDDSAVDANLRTLATQIAGCSGGCMQIVAGTLPCPWAVMYDGLYVDPDRKLETAADVDPSRFWGVRFHIYRTADGHFDGSWPPPIGDHIRVQLCLNKELDDPKKNVYVVEAQRKIFEDIPHVDASPGIESGEALLSYLADQRSPCDLLYFFCHATAAETMTATFFRPREDTDVQAKLILDAEGNDGATLTVKEMLARRHGRPLADRPLVILNACSSAAGDVAFQSKFVTLFTGTWRARGFVGTDWVANTQFADQFGRHLVRRLLADGCPIADAIAEITREAFAAKNPFALMYALYAQPDLTLKPGAAS
jgi:hypothetical protein